MSHASKVDPSERYREQIWTELAKVARPDSRFHWDFHSFIADFEGSERCAQRIADLPCYKAPGMVFVTPDNSTEAFRLRLLRDGRPFLMTTYGIGRGFLRLDPSAIPPEDLRYAATLDGADRYGTPATLADIARGLRLGLLVTGGSAVSRNGVRFGKGHGFFDLEWALLSEIAVVDGATEIVDVVHDCQVVDEDLEPHSHDATVDWIVTPTATMRTSARPRPPGRVHWDLLIASPLGDLPPVRELRASWPWPATSI